MYILTDEPSGSGTLICGAFDALDQAFGTDPFTRDQAIHAIANHMEGGTTGAESLFRDLESRGCITEVD